MITSNSFFDTTTNLWSDAFLAGRGGDFDNDDDGNNDNKDPNGDDGKVARTR